jgi:hypothetical protein
MGYYQCMRTTGRGNMVAWYANLWHTPNKRRKTDNNVTFYVYFDVIRYIIEHTPCIKAEMVETYLVHCAIQIRDAPYVYSRKKGPCMTIVIPTNYKLTSEDVS